MDTLPHMGQPPCDSQWNQRTHQILPFCNMKTQRRTDGNAWRISVAIMVAGAIFSSALYHFSGGIASIMAEKRVGTLVGADARLQRVRRQCFIAVFAGRSEFKHGVLAATLPTTGD